MTDEEIRAAAIEFAKRKKNRIAKELTDLAEFPPNILPVSIFIEKIHDYALHRKQNFILDGTLAKYEKAVENISRSLKNDRSVFVFYVYQRPNVQIELTTISKSGIIETYLKNCYEII